MKARTANGAAVYVYKDLTDTTTSVLPYRSEPAPDPAHKGGRSQEDTQREGGWPPAERLRWDLS